MQKNNKKVYIPRIVPTCSTTSKVFIDKKTKSKSRRVLNRFDW